MLYNGAAQYKIPDKIEFINRWPTTKMEKIDTEKLKQLALEKWIEFGGNITDDWKVF